MNQSKRVFIDHTIFAAYIDRAHPKYEQADAYIRFLAQEEYQVFTDMPSVMTAYNKIYADISPSLAKDFMRTLALSNINILYPDESDAKAALKALVNYQSTELKYQQALMAVLAVRRNISQVCTFEYLHPLFGINLFYLPI